MIELTFAQVAFSLLAFVLGLIFFAKKKTPLYFKLLLYAVACFLLESLYYLTDFACTGVLADTLSFADFGASAAYAFMLSANFGQFDSIVDDGSKECRRVRIIALLAPVALVALYIFGSIYYLKTVGDIGALAASVLGKLPAFFAAYYHMKHLILPDKLHFLVDSMRPCNAFCLLLIIADILSDIVFVFGDLFGLYVCDALVTLMLVFVMITAERGRRKWNS